MARKDGWVLDWLQELPNCESAELIAKHVEPFVEGEGQSGRIQKMGHEADDHFDQIQQKQHPSAYPLAAEDQYPSEYFVDKIDPQQVLEELRDLCEVKGTVLASGRRKSLRM